MTEDTLQKEHHSGDRQELCPGIVELQEERVSFTTERANLQEALFERDALLESIFSNPHFLGAHLDVHFNIIRVTRAFANIEGLPPEYFVGKNYFDLYPDYEYKSLFQRVFETGEPFLAEEKPPFNPAHPERGVSSWDLTLQPVKRSDGKMSGMTVCRVDRASSRWAQDALTKSERKFRAIFDSSPDAITIADDSGRCTAANDPAAALLGLQREDIIGRPISDFLVLKSRSQGRGCAGGCGHRQGGFPSGPPKRSLRCKKVPAFCV